jgi:hypothetical protein
MAKVEAALVTSITPGAGDDGQHVFATLTYANGGKSSIALGANELSGFVLAWLEAGKLAQAARKGKAAQPSVARLVEGVAVAKGAAPGEVMLQVQLGPGVALDFRVPAAAMEKLARDLISPAPAAAPAVKAPPKAAPAPAKAPPAKAAPAKKKRPGK